MKVKRGSGGTKIIIEDLVEDSVEFIRKAGNFKTANFEAVDEELFQRVYGSLRRQREKTFKRLSQKRKASTLVDIGSGLDYDSNLAYLKKFPDARVFLVDKMPADEVKWMSGWFEPEKVEYKKNIDRWVNALLRAHNLPNARYIHGLVEPGTHLDIETQGDRVVFTGFKNPVDLGLLTIQEAIRHGAHKIYLNQSSFEYIEPDSWYWYHVREFLKDKMDDGEFRGFVDLIHDKEVRCCCDDDKYRENKIEKMFAKMLKLPIVLAAVDILQRNRYAVILTANIQPYGWSYNKPDYNIFAQKTKA